MSTATTTRRTQAERRATTRAALLAAARDLFTERGFAATGRDDIAERAGVTRGALYHHFDSKEAVFRAVVLEIEDELVARVAKVVAAAPPGPDQVRAACLAYVDACTDPAMRRLSVLEAPVVLGPEECRELTNRYWLELARTGLAGALHRPADDPDIEVTAHLLLGALNEAGQLVATAAKPARARKQVAESLGRFIDRLLGG